MGVPLADMLSYIILHLFFQIVLADKVVDGVFCDLKQIGSERLFGIDEITLCPDFEEDILQEFLRIRLGLDHLQYIEIDTCAVQAVDLPKSSLAPRLQCNQELHFFTMVNLLVIHRTLYVNIQIPSSKPDTMYLVILQIGSPFFDNTIERMVSSALNEKYFFKQMWVGTFFHYNI